MRRRVSLLILVVMATTMLSGCLLVPVPDPVFGGRHGGGGHGHGHGGWHGHRGR